MNTKPNLIISLVVLLAGMMLLVACNSHQPNVVSASEPEPVEAIAVDEFESVEPGEVVQVLEAEQGGMQLRSAGFSGDDSYDPAAEWVIDSVKEIKAPAEEHVFSQTSGGSLSGDDVYDPAGNLMIEIPLSEHYFTPSGGANYSGDDFYDSAADLTGEEINYAANFPCEEASADQHGSGTISSDDAIVGMDPDDVVAYDWARFFGNGQLENLKDPDDVVAYDWARFFGYEPLENLKDADDVVAYDWARFFGNKPLENLTHTDDVVAYDWARFFGNGPLSTK